MNTETKEERHRERWTPDKMRFFFTQVYNLLRECLGREEVKMPDELRGRIRQIRNRMEQ